MMWIKEFFSSKTNIYDNKPSIKTSYAKNKRLNRKKNKNLDKHRKKTEDERDIEMLDNIIKENKNIMTKINSDSDSDKTEQANENDKIRIKNDLVYFIVNLNQESKMLLIKDHKIMSATYPSLIKVNDGNTKCKRYASGVVSTIKTNIGNIQITSSHVGNQGEWTKINPYVVSNLPKNMVEIAAAKTDLDNTMLTCNDKGEQCIMQIDQIYTVNTIDNKHKVIQPIIIFAIVPTLNIKISGSLVFFKSRMYIVDKGFMINEDKLIVIAFSMIDNQTNWLIKIDGSDIPSINLSKQVDEIKTYKQINVFNLSSAPWEFLKMLLDEEYEEKKWIFVQKPLIPNTDQFTMQLYKPLARGNSLIVVDEDDNFKRMKIGILTAGMRYTPNIHEIKLSTEQSATDARLIMVACDQHTDCNLYRSEGWQPIDSMINTARGITLVYKRPNRSYSSGEAGIRAFCRKQENHIIIENQEADYKTTFLTMNKKQLLKTNFLEINKANIMKENPYKEIKSQYRAGSTDYLNTPIGFVHINNIISHESEENESTLKKIADTIRNFSIKVNNIILSLFNKVYITIRKKIDAYV